MNQFKLMNATVDVSRGEITREGGTVTVEPKVMSVLLLLVEAQGKVVSQEEIFTKVWPSSIFSQSSVQRCIAILRKLLGDDAKRQSIIVTHPKRGYSLSSKITPLTATVNESNKWKLIITCILILIVTLILVMQSPNPDKDEVTQVQDSQLINATVANESQPKILSDQYISYVRDEQGKGQAIWLHDLVEQNELRISGYVQKISDYQWLDKGILLYASFANRTVYIHRVKTEVNQSIKINEAEKSNTPLLEILDVDTFRGFFLTQNNTLIYQAVINRKSQLRKFDLGSGEDVLLLDENNQFSPYGFSVNISTKQVAILGFTEAQITEVKLLSLSNGKTEHLAKLDSNIYHISWVAEDNNLLLTQGKKLIHLDMSGETSDIAYRTTKFIQEPSYNTQGNLIAFTQLHVDSDLWLAGKALKNSKRLVDSTASDYGGAFSPNGKQLAYISNKRGFPQIYLLDIDTQQTQVIFNNPKRKLILSPPIWHPSESTIISSLNEKLLRISLENGKSSWQVFETSGLSPIGWYTQEDAILVIDLSKNNNLLSKYDLVTKRVTSLTEHPYFHGVLGPEDTLFIITQNSVVEIKEGQELDHPFEAGLVISTFGDAKGIYLHTKDEDSQLLHYFDFDTKTFAKPQPLSENVYQLWGINPINHELLFETSTTNKDIVLLKLK